MSPDRGMGMKSPSFLMREAPKSTRIGEEPKATITILK